jgi:hypothetical protein
MIIIYFGRYKSSPSENKTLEAMFLDGNTSRDRCGSSKGWGSFEPESRQPSSSNYACDDRPVPRRDPPSVSSSSVGNEAQKKFGSAKAISSEQFFGGSSDNNVSFDLIIFVQYCNRSRIVFYYFPYLSWVMVSCTSERLYQIVAEVFVLFLEYCFFPMVTSEYIIKGD